MKDWGLFGRDKTRGSAMMMAALLGFAGYPIASQSREPEPKKPTKKSTKCLLPGCGVDTLHPGGYCKAEHCREHQKMLRESRAKV